MSRTILALAAPLLLLAALPAEASFGQSGLEEVEVLVSPQTILLASRARGPQRVEVTVHAEIDYSDVATFTVKLNDIESLFTLADARGDLVALSRSDPLIGATAFAYDPFNRRTAVTDPNGVTTRTGDDPRDRGTFVGQ